MLIRGSRLPWETRKRLSSAVGHREVTGARQPRIRLTISASQENCQGWAYDSFTLRFRLYGSPEVAMLP